MSGVEKSNIELLRNLAEAKQRSEEVEDILRAIRSGEVDALLVEGPHGDQVYTLKGADHPYRVMVEAMNEGAVTLTADGAIFYSNKSFADMLGRPLGQVIGTAFGDYVVEDDLSILEALLSKGETVGSKGEIRLKSASESVIPVYVSINSLQIDGALGLCAIVTDLTEQKRNLELIASERAERLVRRQSEAARQRITNILESITDSFFALDREWNITDVNHQAASIFRRERGELIGKNFLEMFPQDVNDEFRKHYERAMAEQKPVHFEAISNIAKGHWFEFHLYPSPEGLSVYFRDITDRKRVEQEREDLLAREQEARKLAETANRVKDEFLATLSHELRTPLNAILGWTELLKTKGGDENFLAHAVEVIRRNAKAQVQLIEDILDVSRIIAGNFHLETTALNLVRAVEAAIDTVRPLAEAKGIRLRTSLGPMTVVSGDLTRLQQVVWNLLSNAIKFTPSGGLVEVRLEEAGSEAQIVVTDQGEGISPDFLPYIFDRFRQKDSSYARKHSGLGLGLAIVRHVVELHGGRIEAYSAGEGRGATFTVKLPLAARSARKPGANQAEQRFSDQATDALSLAGLRVLLVEDDTDTREMLTVALELHGASVRSAPRADAGFEVLRQWQADVLVSDVGMPDEDGYSFMRKVRSQGPDNVRQIPAIALTGYAGDYEDERARAAGYHMYLTKPTLPELLVESIAKLAKLNGKASKA
jgi:PAS domain S-box-containing protein